MDEVRFTDGPSTAAEIDVDAPPDRVWPVVADIAVPARFSAELQQVRWLDGAAGPALGARFVGVNSNELMGTWETTSTIVEWEPGRRLGWAVADPANPSASWRFELQPAGGGTRVRHWARLGPGPSALTEAIAERPHRESRIIA